MDPFAYFKLYRWLMGGEWVYILDQRTTVYYWTRPVWLRDNRFRSEYEVVHYENW